jgi:hypothetical protein
VALHPGKPGCTIVEIKYDRIRHIHSFYFQMITKISFLILSALLSSSLFASDSDSLKSAEIIAQEYLTAFYHGELKTAADLTHPEMLLKTKRDFLKKAESGALDDSPFGEFVASKEFGELLSIPPGELFIKIQELSRSAAPPQATEAMKKARITVVSSESPSDSMVKVVLNVFVPTASGGREQNSPVYLRKFRDEYRVTVP